MTFDYYCFSAEPLPDHPRYWEVQAGHAHVVVLHPCEDCEATARHLIAEARCKVLELQATARGTTPAQLAALPPEAQAALRQGRHHLEFVAYETGGGGENPGNPFA